MNVTLLAVTDKAEKLIEDSARVCYQSESSAPVGSLIIKLIKSGHHSVLEHASASFIISGVSRALTHQLVRHRLCSFSQQSQRYVKEDQFEYVIPVWMEACGPEGILIFKKHMEQIQEMYNYWKNAGAPNEDARFVLPNACCSEIVVSANFRQWRHLFETRSDKHAQWEIRDMSNICLVELFARAPNVFRDLYEEYILKPGVEIRLK